MRRFKLVGLTLINILIIVGLNIVATVTEVEVVFYLYLAYVLAIAVTVRRLHDTGKPGWWYLILLVPLNRQHLVARARGR